MCWQLGKEKQSLYFTWNALKNIFFFLQQFFLDQAGITDSYLQNLTFFAHFFALAFFTPIFWINNFTWKFKISGLERMSCMKRMEPLQILTLLSWNFYKHLVFYLKKSFHQLFDLNFLLLLLILVSFMWWQN